jgi:hypothetical protein
MTRRCARSLVAVPAAVLAATLGVTAALAATTWTVRPGGPLSLTSGTLTFRDTKTGSDFTCTSSRFSGTLKSGSALSGTRIGSLTAVSFTSCTNPLGVTFTLTATDLPWHVNFSAYNATTGVAAGSISHIHINVSSPGCGAVIDGTSAEASDGIVKISYTNSTAKLKTRTTGGNLHFYNVAGCLGLFITGDPVTVSAATFTASPKQAITSP